MKYNPYIVLAALTLILVSVATGCVQPAEALDANKGNPMDLDGTTWTLTELPGLELLPDHTATLDFADGQVSGKATCNRFFGPYELDRDSLSFGPLGSTMMACLNMEQETAYLKALETVSAYRLEGELLVLLNADGDTVLVFAPTRHASFEGTTWRLTGYNTGSAAIRSLILDTEITATWAEGQVTGRAGCNSYFGGYELDGERLTVDAIGATEMFCAAPEGVMEQEQAYLKALGRAAGYRIQEDRLTVLGEGGERLLEFVSVTD